MMNKHEDAFRHRCRGVVLTHTSWSQVKFSIINLIYKTQMADSPSVLSHRLGNRNGIRPVKSWVHFVSGDSMTGVLNVL